LSVVNRLKKKLSSKGKFVGSNPTRYPPSVGKQKIRVCQLTLVVANAWV